MMESKQIRASQKIHLELDRTHTSANQEKIILAHRAVGFQEVWLEESLKHAGCRHLSKQLLCGFEIKKDYNTINILTRGKDLSVLLAVMAAFRAFSHDARKFRQQQGRLAHANSSTKNELSPRRGCR
jgi:hypothetical protein